MSFIDLERVISPNTAAAQTAASQSITPHANTATNDLMFLMWAGGSVGLTDNDTLSVSSGWNPILHSTDYVFAPSTGNTSRSTSAFWWRVATGGSNDTPTVTKGDHQRHGGMLVTVKIDGTVRRFRRQAVTITPNTTGSTTTNITNPGISAGEVGFALISAATAGGSFSTVPSPWVYDTEFFTNRPTGVQAQTVLQINWADGPHAGGITLGPLNVRFASAIVAFQWQPRGGWTRGHRWGGGQGFG